MRKEEIVEAVLAERIRQDEKWGDQSHHNHFIWNTILGEEVGEISEAILEHGWKSEAHEDIKKELIQVIAVAFAWLEGKF